MNEKGLKNLITTDMMMVQAKLVRVLQRAYSKNEEADKKYNFREMIRKPNTNTRTC